MISSSQHRWLMASVVLVALFVVALPAHAGYDKLWRFKNQTGGNRWNLIATLSSLDVIGVQYTDPAFNPWGEATPGIAVLSGVYATTAWWGGWE